MRRRGAGAIRAAAALPSDAAVRHAKVYNAASARYTGDGAGRRRRRGQVGSEEMEKYGR